MRIGDMKKQSQNKPNLLNAQMKVSSVKTKNYEQRTMNNEPIKTNPICSELVEPISNFLLGMSYGENYVL